MGGYIDKDRIPHGQQLKQNTSLKEALGETNLDMLTNGNNYEFSAKQGIFKKASSDQVTHEKMSKKT